MQQRLRLYRVVPPNLLVCGWQDPPVASVVPILLGEDEKPLVDHLQQVVDLCPLLTTHANLEWCSQKRAFLLPQASAPAFTISLPAGPP